MNPYYQDKFIKIYHGDSEEILKTLDIQFDACVTDPPYGLKFMGKKWDYDVPSAGLWSVILKSLKPGAHLLSFAGTRTQHRMAVNIEDAGFEIRDMISYLYDTNDMARKLIETLTPEQLKMLDATFGRDGMLGWCFGSGFPKSMDISKSIDKKAGAERSEGAREWSGGERIGGISHGGAQSGTNTRIIYDVPATEDARKFNGWGSALKPALEPITMARKPIEEDTIAENILKYGTGGINIDGCRVETGEVVSNHSRGMESSISKGKYGNSKEQETHQTDGRKLGRFPANLITDGSPKVIDGFPMTGNNTGGFTKGSTGSFGKSGVYGSAKGKFVDRTMPGFGNSGSAARFFYCAKASKADRGEGNSHPTVKPTKLMEYLINLVLPNGGILVDPFCGSGTTGVAASRLGVHAILIDQDEKSCEIAAKRCSREINNGETAENRFLNDDKIAVTTKNLSQTETSIFDM